VHFEIIGADPERLRGYYAELFGWDFDTSTPVSEAVSEPANYGFVAQPDGGGGIGIPGGVGGGSGYDPRVTFYVGVPDVEVALQRAESLGGIRTMGPAQAPSGLVVGHFTDPEGNLVGLAAAS
jgi:predicted enzyme related to lactoylglutathione lyase